VRLAALALLAACTQVSPAQTPYFQMQLCGSDGAIAATRRVYADDVAEPGSYAEGLAALASLPAPTILDPNCSDQNTPAVFTHFDGIREKGITEAVWRRAAGVPPFVDLPILDT